MHAFITITNTRFYILGKEEKYVYAFINIGQDRKETAGTKLA